MNILPDMSNYRKINFLLYRRSNISIHKTMKFIQSTIISIIDGLL